MAETTQLALPLLEAAQAQKHVTMNEALLRLDALTAPRAVSRRLSTPPPAAAEGDVFVVAEAPGGVWKDRAGELAIWRDGDWSFSTPRPGWRVWIDEERAYVVFDGAVWTEGALGGVWRGAATVCRHAAVDHQIGAGPRSETAPLIPAGAVVLGVTGRVVSALTGGTLASWRLGTPDGPGRYGSGLGASLNSYAAGVTGVPTAYYAPTPLVLEAEGGAFEGGAVRLAVHYLAIVPPLPV